MRVFISQHIITEYEIRKITEETGNISVTNLLPQHHEVEFDLKHKAESPIVRVRKRKFLSTQQMNHLRVTVQTTPLGPVEMAFESSGRTLQNLSFAIMLLPQSRY